MELPKVGLIIDEPYISMILDGKKTWEMRSKRTGKRERIGLIKKGSSTVFGTIEVYDCEGPLSTINLKRATEFHGITEQQIEMGLLDKWNYAWKLRDVKVLDKPIPYKHPNGAVTWVDLQKALNAYNVQTPIQLNRVLANKHFAVSQPEFSVDAEQTEVTTNRLNKVPYAKDGTHFSLTLARGGIFTVGEKGNEHKVAGFKEALNHLKNMKTAKWRRPNSNGNWGIVSAVEWK